MKKCRKVDELKSFRDLDLEEVDVSKLESSSCSIAEIVAFIREMDMRNVYDSLNFSDILFHDLSDDWILGVLYDALKKAGFLSEDIRLFGAVMKNYVGFWNTDQWIAAWHRDGDFNQNYEDFSVKYDDELKKVLAILKEGLTIEQYEMAEFDLRHWGLKIPMDGHSPDINNGIVISGDMSVFVPVIYLSENEYIAMCAARANSYDRLCKQFDGIARLSATKQNPQDRMWPYVYDASRHHYERD